MRKVINILVMAMAVSFAGHTQTANLGIDSTKLTRDTIVVIGCIYWDTIANQVKYSNGGYILRIIGPLVYYGQGGAPNAPVGQNGVKEVQFYLNAKSKPLPEKWIIKLITKQ
jgi:hypothetical protein